MSTANTYDVILAGGGPAGSSAAIQLAIEGARVLLVEEKKFPRPKLCGEFISPECLMHFQRLGVFDRMTSAGGAALAETVFYSARGRSVSVPSEWFGVGPTALGLSRSEMDHILIERAREVGVVVLEETHASGLIHEHKRVRGIRVRSAAGDDEYRSLLTVDATGRVNALGRHASAIVENNSPDNHKGLRRRTGVTQRRFVAFKAHLENTQAAADACEIYFYRGGYGGLSEVEGGASNLCFIVSANDVRRLDSDPVKVMREVLMKNARAAQTLANASARTPWLSVALDTFGARPLTPAVGLMSIGDAAAFIDPFTGSGILMALESGQIAAQIITGYLAELRRTDCEVAPTFARLARDYQANHSRRFNSRLRCSALLRRAAFVPLLAETAITIFGPSTRLRRRLARATRPHRTPLSEPTA